MTDQFFVLTAQVKPKPAPRPRAAAGRRSYLPADYLAWKEATAWMLKAAWQKINRGRPLEGALEVRLYLQPESITVWLGPVESARQGIRGDVDNLAKAALDALVDAGVFGDDRQVEALNVGFGPPETGEATLGE